MRDWMVIRMNKLTDEIVYKKTSHGRWMGISLADRFWSKVSIGNEKECWNWTGSKNGFGCGLLQLNGTVIAAPRVSWFIYYEYDLGELFACHKCDNPSCCNPHHLFAGTHSDNIKDMYNKKRRIAYHGEQVSNAKLTNEQAKLIRKLYYPRTNKRRFEIAKMFNVSEGTIQGVVYNRRYLC